MEVVMLPLARAWVKRPLVQILVVVANISNFHNAWVLDFPEPNKRRKGLRTHISKKVNMAEVYAPLKIMQCEEIENRFHKQLQEFWACCEKTYPRFHGYFLERVWVMWCKGLKNITTKISSSSLTTAGKFACKRMKN